jgi:TonB family protein
MTTALAAARAGEQAKLEEIAHALVIPNYEAWFKDTFGEEMGTRLAAAYKADLDRQEKWFPTLFASLSKQDGEVLVEDVREPRYTGAGSWCGRVLLGASKKDASFYRVGVQQVLHTGLDRLDDAGYFTLVEGAYRRLDCRALGLGPDSLAPPLPHPINGPLRVEGNVQAAKIIKRVQPEYPEEARSTHISGTVRLHVIIGKDGRMKSLEVVSGHPMLQQAALNAVRQWQYQQTLLNGEPVEIDTTIDVIFSLNR